MQGRGPRRGARPPGGQSLGGPLRPLPRSAPPSADRRTAGRGAGREVAALRQAQADKARRPAAGLGVLCLAVGILSTTGVFVSARFVCFVLNPIPRREDRGEAAPCNSPAAGQPDGRA